MPITVVSGDVVNLGPGVGFIVRTSIFGPIPNTWSWRIEIHEHGDESNAAVIMTAPIWSADDRERRIWIDADPDGGQQTFYGRYVSLATGDLVDVQMQLLGTDGVTVEDSGTVSSVKWDTDSSSIRLLPQATGGLTTEQAQQLADDHASINPPLLAHDGTPITGAVGDTIVRPALKFLGIDTTTYLLTGQGTIDVPTFAGVQTGWGIVLDVVDVPPGASYKPGYVRSFHARVAQFLLLWPAKNTEEAMVIDELRLHLEHRTWAWDWANVIAVAYYIEPSWSVNLRFVSAFFP